MGSVGAIIVAAGKGTRMGTKESKQYLRLGGKPILVHTLEVFERAACVDEVILVVGAEDTALCEEWKSVYGLDKIRAIISGGSERQHSVHEGLRAARSEWILVHDGVRPFVTEALIERCLSGARQHERSGAVAAVPVKDTIKQAGADGLVETTPDRSRLWAVQTPQAFRREELLAAHDTAAREGFVGTDDASVAERAGIPVYLVAGDYHNIKITTPDDLEWADFRIQLAAHRGE